MNRIVVAAIVAAIVFSLYAQTTEAVIEWCRRC
jgi:hypothetical protein